MTRSKSRNVSTRERKLQAVFAARRKARLLDQLLANPNDVDAREGLREIVAEEKGRAGPSLRELMNELYRKIHGPD